MHGYQWYMHGYCGYQWLSVAMCMVIVVISGYAWLSVAICMVIVVISGYAWLSVAICMVIVVISDYAWLSVVMHGFQCLVHDLVVFKIGGIKALSSVFN